MDLDELLDTLTVTPAEPSADRASTEAATSFVGRSPAGRTRSVYGGQFLAQALLAAGATTTPDRFPHSLHAYFVRSGNPALPIRYDVETVRDGRSFSHREVRARQDGTEVFRLLASFHVSRPGPSHTDPTETGAVDPAQLVEYHEWAATGTDNPGHDAYEAPGPVELRYEDAPPPGPDVVVRGPQRLWARLAGGPVPTDEPLLHAALLAWLSDKTIADFATLAHGKRWTDFDTDSVSLDHAMWFLRPARADEWLRYEQEAPSTGGGRGFTRGEFVDRAGLRVAIVAQEVLLTLP